MSYKVSLEPSGKQFTVKDGQTVLEAALEAGVHLPFGCRSGGCGACRARVLEGRVRYEALPAALNPQAHERGEALLCQALPASDLRIAAEEMPADAALKVINTAARVVERRLLAHDVMALFVKLPRRRHMRFLAGQYVDILLRDGRRRSFSIASPEQQQDTLELHLRRVPGGQFTAYAFDQMADKTILRLEGPMGNFYLRGESTRPVIMVAGGTGFAPLKSMLASSLADPDGGGVLRRPVHLYWGARSRHDLYEHELLCRWEQAHANLKYTPVLSEPLAEDEWEGRTGWVHKAVVEDHPDLSGHDVYMSGPPPMIEAAREAFPRHRLVPEHFYCDAFDYAFVTWPSRESDSG